MPSAANKKLIGRLSEIDEIITARDAICGSSPGRPAQKQGAAILKAGVTLLAAIFEGFIEELFEEALDLIHASVALNERNELKNNTSRKNNNANNHQVNTLFFYLGIPWIMTSQKIKWKKYSNQKVRDELSKISKARNEVAHGKSRQVLKRELKHWKGVIEKLAERLDEVVADKVESVVGKRPW